MSDFEGASEIGQMDTGPDADAIRALNISILQRVRDGLLRQPAKSSSDGEDVAA